MPYSSRAVAPSPLVVSIRVFVVVHANANPTSSVDSLCVSAREQIVYFFRKRGYPVAQNSP
jgi:hypothetical protein